MRQLVQNLVVPGHVVSELRGVRFSGFPFEWDMAYNNLPYINVQAVISIALNGQTAELHHF
jgi:hypothetical protein